MTDYTITTDFGAKDSLPSGDANKVVKGSEFTTEFTNIQTAVNTKADSAGDTFTGTVTFNASAVFNNDVIVDGDTLFVDVSTDRVGIGTNSPQAQLHVKNNDAGFEVDVDGQVTDGVRLLAYDRNTSTDRNMQYSASQHLFNIGASEKMRINTSGHVGIGTNNPNADLHINNTAGSELRIDTTGGSNVDSVLNFRENGVDRASLYWDGADNDLYLETTAGDIALLPTGNVGIGTNSPDAKLHVDGGDVKISSDLDTSNGDGKPAILFTETTAEQVDAAIVYNGDGISGDNNYVGIGVFDSTLVSEDTLAEQKLLTDLNITRDGKVGIGTTSPLKDLNISNTTGSSEIMISTSDTGTGSLEFGDVTSGAVARGFLKYNHSDNSLQLGSAQTEAMRIDSSGNVGIGTTSPDQKAHLSGAGTQYLRAENTTTSVVTDFGTSSTGSTIINRSAHPIEFFTDSTKRMTIGATGNVGIGTDSPSELLEVSSDTGSTSIDPTVVRISTTTSAGTWDNNSLWGALQFYSADASDGGAKTQAQIGVNTASPTGGISDLTFSTAQATSGTLTERMRIDSSGDLMVGTTSANAFNGGFGVITGTVDYINVGHDSSVAHGNYYAAFRHGTNTIGTITQSGTSGVNYNTSSDERLKENITDSADAGSKIDAIQIRQFDWKSDGLHQDYGVIAQELVTVAPEAVHQPEDSEEMMGVDYSKLVPMLIKEVQSLRSRVAQLEESE